MDIRNPLVMTLAAATLMAANAAPALADTENDSAANAADSNEIIVSAQRREARLQDVPIAITAINGATLAAIGIRSTQDLTLAVPGLNFARSSWGGQPTLRGIGTRNTGNGDESNVATYVDGVYQAKPFALFMDLTDIGQVQVLKGPQGTLFGRNATGGAILIDTRNPDFSKPALDMDASYGRFNAVRGHAYVNVPLSDTIAFNTSLVAYRDDGYNTDVRTGKLVGGNRGFNVRSKVKFGIGSQGSLVLTGTVSRTHNDSYAVTNSLNGNNSTRRTIPGAIIAEAPYTSSNNTDPIDFVTAEQASYTFKYDFGSVNLQAIGSYQHATMRFVNDSDRTYVDSAFPDVNYDDKGWTQEILLGSSGKKQLEWTVGAFYYDGDDRTDPAIVAPGVQFLKSRVRTRSVAVFGEFTLQVGEKLYLTAGARYNHEKKLFDVQQTVPSVASAAGEKSWDNVSPRAIARYEFSPDLSVYASFSQGFKSGVFNSSSTSTTPVEPEKLTAYEGGIKSRLLDGRLSVNLAAFYYDYKNLQIQAIGPNTVSVLLNAASSEVYGVDADFSARISPAFELNGGFAWLHGRYKNYNSALIYNPRVLAGGLLGGNIQAPAGSANGERLVRAPDFTFNFGGTYRADLASAGTLEFNARAFYSGAFYFDAPNRIKQKDYVAVNASVMWTPPGRQFDVTVFGENLADAVRFGSVAPSTRGDPASYLPPRTWGVRLGVHF